MCNYIIWIYKYIAHEALIPTDSWPCTGYSQHHLTLTYYYPSTMLWQQRSCFHRRWSRRLRHIGLGDAVRGESLSGALGRCGQMPLKICLLVWKEMILEIVFFFCHQVVNFNHWVFTRSTMELVVYPMKFPHHFDELFVLLAFWWSMFIYTHKTSP